MPLDLIARPGWVLARWGPESQGWPPPAKAADALQTRLEDMGSVATAGVIVFEVAATPAIVWSPSIEGRTGHEPVLLARARAVRDGGVPSMGTRALAPRHVPLCAPVEKAHVNLPSG